MTVLKGCAILAAWGAVRAAEWSVGRSLRTPPRLSPPRTGSRLFVLAALRALRIAPASGSGRLAASEATEVRLSKFQS